MAVSALIWMGQEFAGSANFESSNRQMLNVYR